MEERGAAAPEPAPALTGTVTPGPAGGDAGERPERRRRGARLHWGSLSDGLLVALVVTGPSELGAIVLREHYRGWWGWLALVAAVGVFAGGAVAGRHRSHARGAAYQGLAVALMTEATVLVADVVRRAVVGGGGGLSAVALWGVSIAVAVGAGVAGGLMGRRRFLRLRRKRRGD